MMDCPLVNVIIEIKMCKVITLNFAPYGNENGCDCHKWSAVIYFRKTVQKIYKSNSHGRFMNCFLFCNSPSYSFCFRPKYCCLCYTVDSLSVKTDIKLMFGYIVWYRLNVIHYTDDFKDNFAKNNSQRIRPLRKHIHSSMSTEVHV